MSQKKKMLRKVLIVILVLLLTFAINAKVTAKAAKADKCVPLRCLAQRGPKVRISVQRNCSDKKVSKCHRRKRCCETKRRCLFNSFCKTTKKKDVIGQEKLIELQVVQLREKYVKELIKELILLQL